MAGCAAAAPCAWASDCMMRYICRGEVHKDFHASFLDGVNYLIDEYGEAAARGFREGRSRKRRVPCARRIHGPSN